MTTILLYALVTATLYYLGARALITRWLWSRYPPWLDKLTICAACSGFWYGLGVGAWGYWRSVPYGPLPGDRVDTVLVVGLASAMTTAIVGAAAIRALTELGSEGGTDAEVQGHERSVLGDPPEGGDGDDRKDAA